MNRKVCMHIVVGVVVLVFASCHMQTGTPAGYSIKLEAGRFEDIPIPYGYEYREADSFTYVSPGASECRCARIALVGDTRVDEVANFYREQLPKAAFESIDDTTSKETGTVTLEFRKQAKNEQCLVTVWRDGTLVHAVITVKPKLY